MEYAIDAGIDYFAYVWYEGSMGIARDFHTKSKYKTQVKMCAVMDGNAIGKQYAHKEMLTLLKEDYYMTVLGGRPLMYYFGTSGNIKAIGEDIKYYRRVCKYSGTLRSGNEPRGKRLSDSFRRCGFKIRYRAFGRSCVQGSYAESV